MVQLAFLLCYDTDSFFDIQNNLDYDEDEYDWDYEDGQQYDEGYL